MTASHSQGQRQCRRSLAPPPQAYDAASTGGLSSPAKSAKPASRGSSAGDGTFWLLAINVAFFVLDKVLRVSQMQSLWLWHAQPRWWQVLFADTL